MNFSVWKSNTHNRYKMCLPILFLYILHHFKQLFISLSIARIFPSKPCRIHSRPSIQTIHTKPRIIRNCHNSSIISYFLSLLPRIFLKSISIFHNIRNIHPIQNSHNFQIHSLSQFFKIFYFPFIFSCQKHLHNFTFLPLNFNYTFIFLKIFFFRIIILYNFIYNIMHIFFFFP